MAEHDAYKLTSTFLQDDQSRHILPRAFRAPTYSLAGANTREPLPHYHRTNSFVTAEYEQLNPNYNQPETSPIWGLAKPFPRVVRPSMRPRRSTAAIHQLVVPEATHGSHLNQATQTVPQIEVTPHRSQIPSRLESRPYLSTARTWGPRQRVDLHGTYSTPVSLPHELAHNVVSTSEKPEIIQEHEQTVQSRDQQPGQQSETLERASQDALDPLSTEPTHQPSTHDFATEPGEYFARDHSALVRFKSSVSDSQSAVEAGRKRVQGYADTAERDPALSQPPRVDWDELTPHETRVAFSKSHGYTNEVQEDAAAQVERHYHNSWAKYRHRLRQPLAEFLGTFVTLTIGLSGSMVHTIADNQYGNFVTAYLSWGLGVMLGIYTAGGISGAHLNPAISIMLSVYRGFPWHHCYRYIIAQFLGAIAASGVVYGLYRDAILHTEGNLLRSSTGLAFYTQPQDWISNTTAFFNEFVATAVATGVILALGDDSNAPPGAGMHAFIIGLLVAVLSMSFSYNTGAALNPARDFGPRLVTLAAGYGSEVFTDRNCWWIWGPWAGTITGSLVGAFVYDAFIFSGGESPVNYPGGQWKERVEMVKNKAAHGVWEKSDSNDEEKKTEVSG